MPRGLGEIAVDAGSPLVAWIQAVHNRGNQTTLMPTQADASVRGLIAEKVSAAKIAPQRPADVHALLLNGYWYIPASSTNQRLYNALAVKYKDAIARNDFWASVQPTALLKDAGKLTREAVSGITGIPTWAFPVLIIAGIAYAGHTVLSSVGDGIRRL